MLAVVLTDKTSFRTTILSSHDAVADNVAIEALARHIAADHKNTWTVRYPLARFLDRDVLRVRLVDHIDPTNGALMAETDTTTAAIVEIPAGGR